MQAPAQPLEITNLAAKTAKFCRESTKTTVIGILYRNEERVEMAAVCHLTMSSSTYKLPRFAWFHGNQTEADKRKVFADLGSGETTTVITTDQDLDTFPSNTFDVLLVTHDRHRLVEQESAPLDRMVMEKLKEDGAILDIVA